VEQFLCKLGILAPVVSDTTQPSLLHAIALRRGLNQTLFPEPQAQPVGGAFGKAALRHGCQRHKR
ncbi:MAG: hypothetical protein H6R47_649, partial [Proteobacteria bacterium]|nr:hypothetical protein [Pseudomonadota bacterium]